MDLPMESLRRQPLFSWLPEEGFKTFASCFDMEAEVLPAGEVRDSHGRIGYLIAGELSQEGALSGRIRPEEVFGILHAADGRAQMAEVHLTALRPSPIIWMNKEIMTSVCYFDCWFHGRFITEMQRLLAAKQRDWEVSERGTGSS